MTRQNAKSRRLRRIHFFTQCLQTTSYDVELFQNLEKLFQNLEKFTMKQQIEKVANSQALMGPHGAGLTLGMFLPSNGILIEVSGFKRRNTRSVSNIYRNIALFTKHAHFYLNPYERNCMRLQSYLREDN